MGRTDWQPSLREGLDGQGRRFCVAMESAGSPARRKIAGRGHCPAGRFVGPIALPKAGRGPRRRQGEAAERAGTAT